MSFYNKASVIRAVGLYTRFAILLCGTYLSIVSNNVSAEFYPPPSPLSPDLHMLWFEFAIDQDDAISKCVAFALSQGIATVSSAQSHCNFYGEVTQEWLDYWKLPPGAEVGMKYVSFGWLVEIKPYTKGAILYLPTNFCPSPYKYNHSTRMCEALCAVDETWNATLKRCESEPNQRDDCTKTAHPIDLVDGAKYRREPVISIGTSFPIELTFYYNNFHNTEKTVQGGQRPLVASEDYDMVFGSTYNRIVEYYVADQIPPLIAGDPNITLYNEWGIVATEEAVPEPYRGDSLRYWRHNYDESLVPRTDGTFTWLQSNGDDIEFDTAGVSPIYSGLSLTAISATEYGYSGHKLRLNNGLQKVFDDRGRLRKVINANGIYHDLQYNDDDLLVRISHSLNGYLDLSYSHYEVSSIYANGQPERPHLTQVVDSAGRHVDIDWDDAITSDKQYYVISSLTAPYITEPDAVREFSYLDPRWGVSLTDIYDTYDGSRHHYAHFEYDDRGRAILSQLVNEVDKVTVDYTDDSTRVITNALDKQTTYRFAQFNEVNRLASVTGESTSQCHQSDTVYTYDDNGNVIEKNVNGVVTQYQYDSHNLETRRTEAVGTPSQRIVTTTWDSDLRQPLTVSYPGQIITYTYDDEGRLLSKTATPDE
jgi:YD repeat-containing protein